MKFIKVTNTATEVSRLSLEKLGLSTKRDNEETIGQFGSGIKFAPIAAIRKGMRWVFTGNDKNGSYVMEYVIRNEDDIPCVYYKYEDYEKPSSFTADAGLLSWEDSFQIVREVIANAIDQAVLTGTDWSFDIVDDSDIKAVDGEFSVFISADPSILEIYENFDKYFSVDRTPICHMKGNGSGYSTVGVKLYEPIDEFMRIYCKGVLVYCTKREYDMHDETLEDDEKPLPLSGLFDYEFSNIELNEERTIKNTFELNAKISYSLSRIPNKEIIKEILHKVIEDDNISLLTGEETQYYEFSHISQSILNSYISYENRDAWNTVFNNVYGKSVILPVSSASSNALIGIKGKGYNPIIIEDAGRYSFLSEKVPNLDGIFGEEFKFDYSMDIDDYQKLSLACRIISDIVPDSQGVIPEKVGVLFNAEKGIMGLTLGQQSSPDKKILISDEHIEKSSISSLVATLVHELDHYLTGCDDGDLNGRLFRDLADARIGELIMQIYRIKMQVTENSDISLDMITDGI